MSFKDHFSGHAGDYAAHRPGYPAELFGWLAAQAPGRGLAWDCASGNGQAAVALAEYFDKVVATDASARQIEAAESHPGVEYRVEPAERSTLESNSADLITVAQAYHWLDHARFIEEAQRLLKPGGVVAIWTYLICENCPEIDALVFEVYEGKLGPFWPPERKLVERAYRDFDFPWTEIETPDFNMEVAWDLDQFLGYISTWSAFQRYLADTGGNPLVEMRPAFEAAWGEPGRARAIRWPMAVRAFRR